MKSLLLLSLFLISSNSYSSGTVGGSAGGNENEKVKVAGGTTGGSAGGTEEEKVKVPTKLKDTEEEIELGKSCLASIVPEYDFSKKVLSNDFLKSEIEKNIIKKPNRPNGRSIASVEEESPRSFDCHMFARTQGDPKFLDIIAPRSIDKVEPKEATVNGISK